MFVSLPSFLPLPLTVADEINLTPRPETNTGKDWCTERLNGKLTFTTITITITFYCRGVYRSPGTEGYK